MNKLFLALPLGALALAGGAYAGERKAHGDTDGDGVVTRAELQAHAGEMFAKLDANRDGKVDEGDRAAHKGEMFDRLDADNNGSISREEFAKAHARKEGDGREHGAGREGHGAGDHKMGERGGEHPRMAMMMMHHADTNNDRVVTKEELTAGMLKHFDAADANKDGKLTAEERKAAHTKMREKMGRHRG